MRPARTGGLIFAAVVCAWFALGVRQAQDTSRASAITSSASSLSPAQARRADALLNSAAGFNPDNGIDLLRGEVASLSGNLPRARVLFERVADAEPLNLEAWVLLAQAALPNRRLVQKATSHIRLLDPVE